MIDRLKKSECCGCNSCGDVCPKDAITFQKDEEGFLNPIIDYKKCIDCGLCEKVCPSINAEELKKNDFEKPKCFAAVNKNLEVRFDSTSGGAFSALAKKAYKHKWYVGGAVWNQDWTVSQVVSNNKHDIERLRSSKYIQSDARGLYKQIKDLLIKGENVLICGTPCQIAALKAYLRKDYENLLTVDFICQYVNSPFVWGKYIEQIEQEHQSKVVYIKDKNKELGWRKLCNKVVFENGDVRYDTAQENYFRRCYMGLGVASRPSCYECRFKGFPRIADITIADFWGVEKYLPKEYDNNLGTSLILCNSQRGMDYLDSEVEKSLMMTEINLEMTLQGNTALTVPYNPPVKVDRASFYHDLHENDIKTVLEDYLVRYRYGRLFKFKRGVKNILKYFYLTLKASRGNILTILKSLWINILNDHVEANLLKGHFVILHPRCRFSFAKESKIKLGGILTIGIANNDNDRRLTYLALRRKALLDVKGNYAFGSGCDIQVFMDAVFTIEGGGDTNMNVEIVCGKDLKFQKHVYIGRNVIIRDTNGEHFISRQGYKHAKPVVLGTHCWICDRATIMPGVHVYPGGIVGANAYVTANVEAFTMVSGNPARVVDEEVYWKS